MRIREYANVRMEMQTVMFITPSPFGEGWGEVEDVRISDFECADEMQTVMFITPSPFGEGWGEVTCIKINND